MSHSVVHVVAMAVAMSVAVPVVAVGFVFPEKRKPRALPGLSHVFLARRRQSSTCTTSRLDGSTK